MPDREAAVNAGGDDLTVPTGAQPMLVLARVQGDQVTVLRGMQTPALAPGSWVRLQLKTDGDILQGAVNTDPTVYVSARDSAFATGKIGVFADAGNAAFKNVLLWKQPRMIRRHWD